MVVSFMNIVTLESINDCCLIKFIMVINFISLTRHDLVQHRLLSVGLLIMICREAFFDLTHCNDALTYHVLIIIIFAIVWVLIILREK